MEEVVHEVVCPRGASQVVEPRIGTEGRVPLAPRSVVLKVGVVAVRAVVDRRAASPRRAEEGPRVAPPYDVSILEEHVHAEPEARVDRHHLQESARVRVSKSQRHARDTHATRTCTRGRGRWERRNVVSTRGVQLRTVPRLQRRGPQFPIGMNFELRHRTLSHIMLVKMSSP